MSNAADTYVNLPIFMGTLLTQTHKHSHAGTDTQCHARCCIQSLSQEKLYKYLSALKMSAALKQRPNLFMDLTLLTAGSYFLLFKVSLWRWQREREGGGGGARMEIKVWPGWPGAHRGVLELIHCCFNPLPEEKRREIKVPQDEMSPIKEWRRVIKISQMWANHSSLLPDWLALFSSLLSLLTCWF